MEQQSAPSGLFVKIISVILNVSSKSKFTRYFQAIEIARYWF